MILIYDGDCGFCTKSADFARKRLTSAVEVLAWQKMSNLATLGLTETDVQTRSYFVDQDGRIFGGAESLARCALHMHSGWPLVGRIFLVPGFAQVASVVYKFVASNRHRLPGGTAACKLPNAE